VEKHRVHPVPHVLLFPNFLFEGLYVWGKKWGHNSEPAVVWVWRCGVKKTATKWEYGGNVVHEIEAARAALLLFAVGNAKLFATPLFETYLTAPRRRA
jgi:hypothetical protein